MPDMEFIEGEIERMRSQVLRQRNEITQLQRAAYPPPRLEALLGRIAAHVIRAAQNAQYVPCYPCQPGLGKTGTHGAVRTSPEHSGGYSGGFCRIPVVSGDSVGYPFTVARKPQKYKKLPFLGAF
jgi:hypothetical protein